MAFIFREQLIGGANTSGAPTTSPPEIPPVVGPLEKNVYERELVTRRLEASSIVQNHAGFYHNVSRRLSPGLCLGFVSPWSARGEEVAWRFGSKLTHLSPLMYGVTRSGNLVLREKPRWLAALREGLACPGCPPPARLVPLVSFEGLDFGWFFGGEDGYQEERAGRLLVALLQQHITEGLDGLVLDAHQYLARLDRQTRADVAPRLHIFVQLLASQLSQQERGADGLLLLVPPHPELFSPTQLAQLAAPLGGFIVSTLNFSAVRGHAGPTAPLGWMRDALAALQPTPEALPKLMATLPMLGWDFPLHPSGSGGGHEDGSELVFGGGEPVDGAAYIALLERHKPGQLDWHAEAAEHSFSYQTRRPATRPGGGADGGGDDLHVVYYPSLRGLAERLGMLRSLGVGVAVWELGSGLDFFWDLL